VLTVDRATSDGTIIDVQRGGTSTATIGVSAGDDVYFAGATGSTKGIYFNANGLLPATTGGGASDGTVDIGENITRWKDLYLSGGVYLGGIGSNNHLDDYEEGTWTPSMDGMGSATFSQQYGRYTKVGNLVHVTGKIAWTGASGTAQVYISGLPFASVDPSDSQQRNSAWPQGDYQNIDTLIDRNGHFRTDGSRLFGVIDNTSGYTIGMSCTTHVSSSGEFNFNVTYRTS